MLTSYVHCNSHTYVYIINEESMVEWWCNMVNSKDSISTLLSDVELDPAMVSSYDIIKVY